MNKWVNPSKRHKTENEFPRQDATTYTSFDTIKNQVRKKIVSRKTKKVRIAGKVVTLAERLGNSKSD